MRAILLADIGGTHSRFALAGTAGRPEHTVVIANDAVADLETAVAHYLKDAGASPHAAVLAKAKRSRSPTAPGAFAATNSPNGLRCRGFVSSMISKRLPGRCRVWDRLIRGRWEPMRNRAR